MLCNVDMKLDMYCLSTLDLATAPPIGKQSLNWTKIIVILKNGLLLIIFSIYSIFLLKLYYCIQKIIFSSVFIILRKCIFKQQFGCQKFESRLDFCNTFAYWHEALYVSTTPVCSALHGFLHQSVWTCNCYLKQIFLYTLAWLGSV